MVCLLGAVDDVRDLDWLVKLAGQIVAASIMAYKGVQLFALPLGGSLVLPGPVLVGLTIFFVILADECRQLRRRPRWLGDGHRDDLLDGFFAYAYLVSRSTTRRMSSPRRGCL